MPITQTCIANNHERCAYRATLDAPHRSVCSCLCHTLDTPTTRAVKALAVHAERDRTWGNHEWNQSVWSLEDEILGLLPKVDDSMLKWLEDATQDGDERDHNGLELLRILRAYTGVKS